MISILYHIAIRLLVGLMMIASPFNQKAKDWIKGRKNLPIFPGKKGFTVWMHCASSGEFEQGKPVIEKIYSLQENITIYLSFYSPSGYLQWRDYKLADKVFYLPPDTSKNAQFLISSMDPDLVMIIKNEFWFNHIREIVNSNIPLIFISTTIHNKKYIFWPYFKSIISQINHFFVQQNLDKKALISRGIHQVTVAGDTRVDRVLEVARTPYDSTLITSRKRDFKYCVIYGSIWSEDMEHIAPFINHRNDILHIIAPHDISNKNISQLSSKLTGDIIYFSKNIAGQGNKIIIDNIGQLKYIYRYAHMAYIGGGFKEGIHNTLEPAVYQIPIIFGPKYKKFPEAVQFVKLQIATSINSKKDFSLAFDSLEKSRMEIKENLEKYFLQNQGATQKIVDYLIKEEYVKS